MQGGLGVGTSRLNEEEHGRGRLRRVGQVHVGRGEAGQDARGVHGPQELTGCQARAGRYVGMCSRGY